MLDRMQLIPSAHEHDRPGEATSGPNRRGFLGGLLAAGAGAVAAAAADGVHAAPARAAGTSTGRRPARTFYVHPSGSDDADGASTSSAWRSLARLNRAFAEREVVHGDTVLLARGRVHAGVLRPVEPPAGDDRLLTIGSYGSGSAPRVSAFKTPTAAGWRETAPGSGRWQVDLAAEGAGTDWLGDASSSTANVGFLKVNDEIRAYRRDSVGDLRGQWEFASPVGSTVLTVRSDARPDTLANVQAAVDDPLVVGASQLVLRGLHLVGTGSNGYSDDVGVHDVLIEHCTVSHVGGSELPGAGRYGNGVQVWQAGQRVTVRRCVITDCWDTATTVQGWDGPWADIVFEQNVVLRCTQAFELWTRGGAGTAGVVSCRFVDNVCHDVGLGWGARPQQVGRGSHVLFYALETPIALEVSGNVFGASRDAVYYVGSGSGSTTTLPAGLSAHDNVVVQRRGRPIVWGGSWTVDRSETFSTGPGREIDSSFVVGDPR